MESSPRRRVNTVLVVVILVGVAVSIGLGITSVQHAKDTKSDWLEDRAQLVATETTKVVSRSIDGLLSVAAFLETIPDATQDEFASFVSGIDPTLSLIGIAYLAIVPQADLDEYIAERRLAAPLFDVTEVSTEGALERAARGRAVYYPVQYFAAGQVLEGALGAEVGNPITLSVGFDGGSQLPWRPGLERAVADDASTVSGFLEVDFGGVSVGKAFIVAVPVHDANGEVVGLVASPMVDLLLETAIDSSVARDVDWHIASGRLDPIVSPTEVVADVDLPGASWVVSVQPTEAARRDLAATPVWIVIALGLGVTGALAVIVDLVAARRRSRKRVEDLRHAGAEKDRFLATVSHEIRTPLTAVMAVASELRDRPRDFNTGEAHELLDLMVEQSDEVAALVDDLLVAGAIDVGGVSIVPSRTALMDEVRHVIAATSVPARVVGDEIDIETDPRRIRQILRNLLTNAQRYGGPDIEVQVEQLGSWVTAAVSDDGPPIPQDKQERMFLAYTTSQAKDPSVGSMGLGLFISTKLAELLGGNLSYSHDGRRSIFSLRLPAAPRGADPAASSAPSDQMAVTGGARTTG